MTDDPLDGYRSIERTDDDLAPMEALLKRQQAQHQHLIKLVQRSEALDRWMQSEAGQALQQEANVQLDEAMGVWLSCDDPGTAEARRAHFRAKVAVGLIDLIGKILQAGPEARRTVEDSDKAANLEMNNG